MPIIGRKADAEGLGGLAIHATVFQVVNGRWCVAQRALIQLGCRGHGVVQRRVYLRAGVLCFPREFEPGLLGQLLNRGAELQPVVLHQEAQRRAMRAAAEAVVELFARRHRKAGCLLVVEGAASGVFAALALERHARVNQRHDVGARDDVVDESLGNECHGASVAVCDASRGVVRRNIFIDLSYGRAYNARP